MPARSYIPPEILSSILDQLPTQTLLPLRTVSKAFLHLITLRIFSKIAINLYAYRLGLSDEYRLGLSERPPLMLIKSLSTSSSTVSSIFNTICNVTLHTTRKCWEDKDNILIDGKTPKAFLSDHLVPFLTRLPNLETVDWTHYVDQKPSLHFATIAQSLSCLAKLQNLAINIEGDDFYQASRGNYKLFPLHTFKNLSSLSVSYSDDLPEAYYNREIAIVIAASPKLTRLSLINRVGAENNLPITESCTSLQTLFGSATSPQLTQLELRYVPLSAAGLNQTLLHKLKSLTISTPIGSRRLKFPWAELFTTLEEIGVELSSLSITGMEAAMDEMFSYLISYVGGLQTLEIRNIMMDCQGQEDKAGHRFWDQIVPHHKGSLKVLCIYPWYEGEWCYGPEAAAALSQCLSLRNLTIAGRIVGSAWAEAKLSLTRTNKVIKSFDLSEPYGHPKNSAALILTDVSSSLARLTLIGTEKDNTRADIIDNLNRGIGPEVSTLLGIEHSATKIMWILTHRNRNPSE